MVVGLAILLCLQQSPTAQPASAPASTPPTEDAATQRYAAIVDGLRAYEASLTGLAWDQEVEMTPPRRGEGERPGFFRSSFVVAPDGRWSLRNRTTRFEDGKPIQSEEQQQRFDGTSVEESSTGSHAGVIRAPAHGELIDGLLSPLLLAGGSRVEPAATPWSHRLSHTLAALTEVSVDESAAPLVRLGGSRRSGDKFERVEVTLDRDRGWLPMRFVRTAEIFDIVREEIVTTAIEQVGAVWVPIGGTRAVFASEPSEAAKAMTPQEKQAARVQIQ